MKKITRLCTWCLSVSLLFSTPLVAQPIGIPSMGAASGAELSPSLEQTLGDAIMEQGRRDPLYVSDPVVNQYLTQLGQRLAQYTTVPLHSQIQVFALRDHSINAFALPGGYIGINTGLMVNAESESELASVVAHEIAHVALRHVARGMTQSSETNHMMVAALVGALLAGLSGSADLAMGVAAFGQAAAVDRQLGFSRQAEQEADRVGYQMLEGAGFNPRGMVEMFKRLMQSHRLNESPNTYATTHPLSMQRLSDIENRVMVKSSSAKAENDDFWFAQAAAMVVQAQGGSALLSVQQRFQSQLATRTGAAKAASYYGLAYAAKQRRDYRVAQDFLLQAQQVGVEAAPIEVLRTELFLLQKQPNEALATAQKAWRAWPQNQAVALVLIEATQQQPQTELSLDFIKKRILQWPKEPKFHQLLASALEQAQQPVEARQAMAQYYILVGAIPSAVSQLQQARGLSQDFYQQSTLDVQIRDLREQLERDRVLLERFRS